MKFFNIFAAASTGLALAACGGGTPTSTSETIAASTKNDGWVIAPPGDLNAFFDCLDAAGMSIVSAHRGGPQDALPENSLEAMQATLRAVPALMEIDVAQSADGVLFLMHDDRLERTTTGEGFAEKARWGDIQNLQLEDENGSVSEFSPPTFEDVLAWAKTRTILQVDFKRSARYEAVIDEIYRQGAEDRVILIAYSMASAQKLNRLAPDMMISLSVASQSDLNRAVAAGVPENRIMGFTGTEAPSERLLTILDRRAVEGIFGTLGGGGSIDAEIARSGAEERYAEIAALGVDIIATDQPRAAHAALTKAGAAPGNGVCGVSRRAGGS